MTDEPVMASELTLEGKVPDREPPYDAVVFDCDSTLSELEGIDELAGGRSAEVSERGGLPWRQRWSRWLPWLHSVTALTRQKAACNSSIPWPGFRWGTYKSITSWGLTVSASR